MARVRRGNVQLAAYVDPRLKDWLEKESKRLPPPQGQGKKETQRLSDYVRMVLEDHRKGGGYVGELVSAEEMAAVQVYRELQADTPEALDAFFTLGELTRRYGPDIAILSGILATILRAAYDPDSALSPGSFSQSTRISRQNR